LRVAVVATASVLVLVACGPDTIDGPAATATDSVPNTLGSATTLDTLTPVVTDPAASALPKPEVQLPAELPTELVITDLSEGTGDAAAEGDTVLVHYVGVRSVDGTEFDNSFDRGEPLSVTLGAGRVIPGWEQGLVGVKQGGRRQLDIPADLAYGDSPSGDIIQPGDALTFVLDVVAVLSAGDPADAPDVSIVGAANQTEIAIEDLVEGTGAALQNGQTAAVQIVAFRADTGEKITSTWEDGGTPFTFVAGKGDVLPGIELAVEGMSVGGRRQVAVPFLLAFGEAGNPDFGLPASTDMVIVIDLVAIY
jgi:peptidylprolyl isomerase